MKNLQILDWDLTQLKSCLTSGSSFFACDSVNTYKNRSKVSTPPKTGQLKMSKVSATPPKTGRITHVKSVQKHVDCHLFVLPFNIIVQHPLLHDMGSSKEIEFFVSDSFLNTQMHSSALSWSDSYKPNERLYKYRQRKLCFLCTCLVGYIP